MSTLLVDLGNTALKWSTMEDADNPHTVVHNGEGHFREELYAQWLALKPDRVVGCTVAAPHLALSATKFFNDHNIAWEWLRPQAFFANGAFTLENGYANPMQLGADRWNAAIGAVRSAPGSSLLVVHMGTATTADAVLFQKEGAYRFMGGRIAPGVNLMLKALTEKIPTLNVSPGEWEDFPRATGSAIATGIIDAQVGLVLQACGILEKKGPAPKVLLAGGAANWIAPHLESVLGDRLMVSHNLVLGGLAERALAEQASSASRPILDFFPFLKKRFPS